MNIILHICYKEDWEQAQFLGEYRGNLTTVEGFIHCSKPEQIIEVANTLFKGQNDLFLLVIDEDKIKAEIKYEDPGDLEPTGKLYPHIYGPLNFDAVISVKDFQPDSKGLFTMPELF